MDLYKLCRLCLEESPEPPDSEEMRTSLLTKVELLFSLENFSDTTLPSRVCLACENKTNDFYEFALLVKSSQERILQLKSSFEDMKEELKTESDIDALDCTSTGGFEEESRVSTQNEEQETSTAKRKYSKRNSKKKSAKVTIEVEPKQKKASVCATSADDDQKIKQFFELSCNQCGVSFERFSNWKSHMRTKHKDNNPGIVCCNKKLYRRHHLLTHCTLHMNPDEFK